MTSLQPPSEHVDSIATVLPDGTRTVTLNGEVLVLHQDDVILIRVPRGTRAPDIYRMNAAAEKVLGPGRLLILGGGCDLVIARDAARP